MRHPYQNERFYMLMLDRFANGDTANDRGSFPSSDNPAESGFDPTNSAFYHGGDFRGLIDRLDYIKGSGATALWINPIFVNKTIWEIPPFPMPEARDTMDDAPASPNYQAAYHGYFVTDLTTVDPHWGSEEDFARLIREAHKRGMKIFLDIEINLTADVISHPEPALSYRGKTKFPYRDASGHVFNDRDYLNADEFPVLDPQTSFPYRPVIAPEEANIKKPAWLNNPIYYHNRGSWFTPLLGQYGNEDETYGDMLGLDDLFTEHPRVVRGMIDIYKKWIDRGVDGFRIDTMKHVNLEFWQQFIPAMVDHAREQGNKDFFTFGEVWTENPKHNSKFTTTGKVQATLDFPFQAAARRFASKSMPASNLAEFFDTDDYYTDQDSNAYQLPTFLGNHDMGRIGAMLKADNPSAADDELLARDTLAHALMMFSRGVPITYYGDEQGFTGGEFEQGREDLFASQSADYQHLDHLGTDRTGGQDNYDMTHPLYQATANLSRVRAEHPALRVGAQLERYASPAQGIYAFSRIARGQQVEYLVVLNNASVEQAARIPTGSPRTRFESVYGPDYGRPGPLSADDGALNVTMPPLSAAVYRAAKPMPPSTSAPRITSTQPSIAPGSGGRVQIGADVASDRYAEVRFTARVGDCTQQLGTDDNAPYRVYADLGAYPANTPVKIVATVNDLNGHRRAAAPITYVVEK